MTNKNFSIIEGKKHKIYFNLTNVENQNDFQVFGFFKKIGCCNSVFELEEINNELYIPELENGIFNYQIFIKQHSTNKDFLALEGKIEVKNSLMEENNSVLGGTELDITFDANTIEIHCEIGQGLRGEKGEKGEKGDKGETDFIIDQSYNATSENAQSGIAVAQATANCLQNGGSIGGLIQIGGASFYPTRMGYGSYNAHPNSVAIGAFTTAHWYSTALGYQAKASVGGTMALGANITVKDTGVAAIAVNNKANAANADNLQTILYIISEGSALANTYEDGEACLGYIVRDNKGNIQKSGTRKLSELLTNNTTFAPATLDLDAPEPKVFQPTGITDPIEITEGR